MLSSLKGAPVIGIVNEVTRILRTNGGNSRQLAESALIQSLGWYSDFVIWGAREKVDFVNEQYVKSRLEPLVKRIVDVAAFADDEFYPATAGLTMDILTPWRLDFVKYFDLHIEMERARQRELGIRFTSERRRSPSELRRRGDEEK
jgi:hypothetical protein